jgi:putative transposase
VVGSGSCVIKKDRCLGKGECPKKIRFLFIRELSSGHQVSWLCRIAGVSRAGYYKWLTRQTPITAKNRENQELQSLLRSGYSRNRGRYGYRRMQVWLNRQTGQSYNHKRVYRLFDIIGLKVKIRRKKRWYVRAEAHTVSPNLLNRRFGAWVSPRNRSPFNDKN